MLARGADTDGAMEAADYEGRTAVALAASTGHTAVVEALVAVGGGPAASAGRVDATDATDAVPEDVGRAGRAAAAAAAAAAAVAAAAVASGGAGAAASTGVAAAGGAAGLSVHSAVLHYLLEYIETARDLTRTGRRSAANFTRGSVGARTQMSYSPSPPTGPPSAFRRQDSKNPSPPTGPKSAFRRHLGTMMSIENPDGTFDLVSTNGTMHNVERHHQKVLELWKLERAELERAELERAELERAELERAELELKRANLKREMNGIHKWFKDHNRAYITNSDGTISRRPTEQELELINARKINFNPKLSLEEMSEVYANRAEMERWGLKLAALNKAAPSNWKPHGPQLPPLHPASAPWRRPSRPEMGGGKTRTTPKPPAGWMPTKRTVVCRDGVSRVLHKHPAKLGELRVRRMVQRGSRKVATFVKP
jgi:hypothetical protein